MLGMLSYYSAEPSGMLVINTHSEKQNDLNVWSQNVSFALGRGNQGDVNCLDCGV